MRPLIVLAALALAACQTAKGVHTVDTPSVAVVQCLPMATYGKADQQKAAAELQALPQGSTLARFVVDYGQLRAANRALCGAGK